MKLINLEHIMPNRIERTANSPASKAAVNAKQSHGNDEYVVKKVAQAKAFIEKTGLPQLIKKH
ncbi:hypothetical protein DBR40_07420 [Pedobacter sp. KBW01]|uniref:hypothetical protein n=1 Tax=Pedobacter sp. KBW01 TaxID=2153364 RepID=UPI000F59049F|nr:hypothetical protein [Pedobacter sp. KBW01]RQO77796.1 hypothetical protein DBR40_07420 [Pedobacter sp. KBW01]